MKDSSMDNCTLRKYIDQKKIKDVKLHLGCGGVKYPDFINIDLYPSDSNIEDCSRGFCIADVYCDIRKLDVEPNSVTEIFSSHVVEHFVKWEAQAMFKNWYTVLKKDGKLIIETPDFLRCVMLLFHIKKRHRVNARSQFYGNQKDKLMYETHRYVWDAKEIKCELLNTGFSKVTVTHKTKTHKKFRDMRIIAIK